MEIPGGFKGSAKSVRITHVKKTLNLSVKNKLKLNRIRLFSSHLAPSDASELRYRCQYLNSSFDFSILFSQSSTTNQIYEEEKKCQDIGGKGIIAFASPL